MSPFDKIYIRGEGNECGHIAYPDDLLVDIIREILADQGNPVSISRMISPYN